MTTFCTSSACLPHDMHTALRSLWADQCLRGVRQFLPKYLSSNIVCQNESVKLCQLYGAGN